MKVIIAGSRTLTYWKDVEEAVEESGFKISQVVSGGAAGVDANGEAWAARRNIPVKVFYPDWDTYGKSAGPMRNQQMASYADALIAVWDGKSRGTRDMIKRANVCGLRVYVKLVYAR